MFWLRMPLKLTRVALLLGSLRSPCYGICWDFILGEGEVLILGEVWSLFIDLGEERVGVAVEDRLQVVVRVVLASHLLLRVHLNYLIQIKLTILS